MKILKLMLIILLHTGAFVFCFYVYIKFIQPAIFHNSPNQSVLSTTSASMSSHSLAPVISNQWYSAIYKTFPTPPIYALPLVFKLSSSGIGFSYPSMQITANDITSPYTEDFALSTGKDFTQVKPLTIGDWSINLELLDQASHYVNLLIGHGFPFATIDTDASSISLNPKHSYTISDGAQYLTQLKIQTTSFLLTTNKNNYIIAFDTTTNIQQEPNQITIQNPKHIFIGLLDKPQSYNNFKQIKNLRITDTQVYPSIDNTFFNTQYKVTTNGIAPILALYPHQYENLAKDYTILGQYQTIRGPLKLIRTDNFTTKNKIIIPNQTYKKLSLDHPDLHSSLKQDIADYMREGKAHGQDYYLGTWFGKGADLLLLSDTLGETDLEKQLLSYLEPIFYDSLKNFSYNKIQTSVVAQYPEFGNEKNNDHHFHYGYYIRMAAVLASLDLPSLQKTQPMIDQMTADIATTKRDETQYPFLRHFDLYESHSWADGYALNQYGNNQESSSEAINAWYSVYLWSQVTNNETLRQYSLYLYNAEVLGAKYYWFNNSNIYPKPYNHAIVTRVWGGRIDFQTWFSNQTNMKYGIQILPLTPASMYLGQLSNFNKYEKDFLSNNGSIQSAWGDQYLVFKSFYDPHAALQEENQVTQLESNNTVSKLLYFLYINSNQ